LRTSATALDGTPSHDLAIARLSYLNTIRSRHAYQYRKEIQDDRNLVKVEGLG
jgi:hypothetical protein